MAMNELQLARTMQQNERERWSRVASRMSSRRNQSNEKPASARSVSLCSMMRSRWILFVSALLFAFLSIGLAWYTEQFSRISIPWSESVEFH
ncbi:unnamed protein product [Echinostoma caproni]|uniref:Uncharacterized protein n=1 Tax=Echinostoma caproni TaxID=27848 RepID=A0A183AN61_9TREM|nr:unnamed protein product [Echinostoma caproni]